MLQLLGVRYSGASGEPRCWRQVAGVTRRVCRGGERGSAGVVAKPIRSVGGKAVQKMADEGDAEFGRKKLGWVRIGR